MAASFATTALNLLTLAFVRQCLHVALILAVDRSAAVQVTLLDTTKSESLNWLTHSRGDNVGRRGWREASYTRVAEGDVVRVYTVCNVAVSAVDNWLRTPHIPPSPANRLYVDIQFSMRKCTKYPNPGRLQQCKESLKLLYREADEPSFPGGAAAPAADVDVLEDADDDDEDEEVWSEDAYQHIDVIAADRVFTDNSDAVVNTETRSVAVALASTSGRRGGVYFAFRDQGACATLLSVRVYYVTCPAVVVEFARFAETPAGPEVTSVVQRDGECVSNAAFSGSGRPSYLCKADGSWYFLSAACRCLPGYQAHGGNTECSACPAQTYKVSNGSDVCRPCPRHSETVNVASAVCPCRPGYYRSHADEPSSPCTAPPSGVVNLTVAYFDQSTVNLSWLVPVDLGGRSDLTYSVECAGCGDRVVYVPGRTGINSTSVSIAGLSPGMSYKVTVRSVNGVSAASRTSHPADITVITDDAVPDKVRNVRVTSIGADYVGLAWDPQTYMHIDVFELRHWAKNDVDGALTNVTMTPNVTLTRLAQGTTYSIKVRGKSRKGWGEYSDVVVATTGHIAHYPMDNPTGIIIGSAVAVIICMIIVVIMVAAFVRRSSRMPRDKQVVDYDNFVMHGTYQYPQAHIDGTLVIDSRMTIPLFASAKPNMNYSRTYVDPHTYEDPSRAVHEFTKEIDASSIVIEAVIGGGEFGDVCKGRMKVVGQTELEVAIKTLKPGTSEKSRLDFLTEASIMGQFRDPNVIYLQGVVTRSHPTMIVTEYMQNGSLDSLLRKNDGNFTILQLVGMVRGIASGMFYLSSMGYVHRDLAARNILVDENLVCKVSDFGLSREVEGDSSGGTYTTKGGKIPVRWTAPEAITYRKFTSASDVWSYGVVVWEVMSYGERPYWNWTNQDVIKAVDSGYRLPPPMDCPELVYQLMLDSWQTERSDRPKFAAIVKILDKLMQFPELLLEIARPRIPQMVGDRVPGTVNHSIRSILSGTVNEWLTDIKMERYIENFERCGYRTMEDVALITHRDLSTLGVSLVGHQKKILNSVQALRSGVQSRPGDPLLA